MKVDERTRGKQFMQERTITTYACPKCGCIIHLDWEEPRNYCPNCGVKLDFEEK